MSDKKRARTITCVLPTKGSPPPPPERKTKKQKREEKLNQPISDEIFTKLTRKYYDCNLPECVKNVRELLDGCSGGKAYNGKDISALKKKEVMHCSSRNCHEVYFTETRGIVCEGCFKHYCENCYQYEGFDCDEETTWYCYRCEDVYDSVMRDIMDENEREEAGDDD
jgi:hypothetical protein